MIQTATKTRKSHKPQKQVQVIARYTLKRNGHVIYAVRSSNGVDQYQVLVIGGVVQSCDCAAHGHCYHKRGIQIIEENRREAEMKKEQAATPAPIVETPQQDGTIEVETVQEDGSRKQVATIRRVQPETVPTHEGEGKLPQETRQALMNWHQSQAGDAMEREYLAQVAEENRKAEVRYMYNDL